MLAGADAQNKTPERQLRNREINSLEPPRYRPGAKEPPSLAATISRP
jgi:hypothetical protein